MTVDFIVEGHFATICVDGERHRTGRWQRRRGDQRIGIGVIARRQRDQLFAPNLRNGEEHMAAVALDRRQSGGVAILFRREAQGGGHGCDGMLLPPPDKGRNPVQIAKRRAAFQFERAVGHAIERLLGGADADPLHRQAIAVELIGIGEVATHRQRRARLGGQVRHLADMGYLFATRQDDRPAIFPCHGQQEGFAPDIV